MGYPHKPHPKETVLLSRYFGEADARTYKGWVKRGGYAALEQARAMEPTRVVDIVKESGLRGRWSYGSFPGQTAAESVNLADLEKLHSNWAAMAGGNHRDKEIVFDTWFRRF